MRIRPSLCVAALALATQACTSDAPLAPDIDPPSPPQAVQLSAPQRVVALDVRDRLVPSLQDPALRSMYTSLLQDLMVPGDSAMGMEAVSRLHGAMMLATDPDRALTADGPTLSFIGVALDRLSSLLISRTSD